MSDFKDDDSDDSSIEITEDQAQQAIYIRIETTLPKSALPKELFHFIKVIENGAKKYSLNGWLQPNGKNCSEKDMHDSMFHHLAESFVLPDGSDKDSGLSALLHLQCRAAMIYTRRSKGLTHDEDREIMIPSIGKKKNETL